jgi:non-canonical purine NTP pyrophosphatase (RdgB/HAM1 family)
MKLLIATRNRGKLREYRRLLAELQFELLDLTGASITHQVDENGISLLENAALKAASHACMSGLLTLADDSGLEVDALSGEPGVRSARYGGFVASDEDRYRLLLRRLQGFPEEERGARFRCVIAIATPAKELHTFEGVCEGRIAGEPVGSHGFGYDPVFFHTDSGRTMAQMTEGEKNAVSHRARATEKAQQILCRLREDTLTARAEPDYAQPLRITSGLARVPSTTKRELVLKQLSDDLILRRATEEDLDTIAAFNADIHRDWETGAPDEGVSALTRDLMSGHYFGSRACDFSVVEDTRRGVLVSSMCLVSQTWSYGGIEFQVGRPELIGTHPDYRRRGLVRAQFDTVHRWSAERGDRAQAILGIPHFYRQFGYEMGLAAGGGRRGYMPHVPELEEDMKESHRVRPATLSDVQFMVDAYQEGTKRSLIACVLDDASWHYQLVGRDAGSVNRSELRIVETVEGERVGILAHPPQLWGTGLTATLYELKAGHSWMSATPSVIRYLQTTGTVYARRDHCGPLEEFSFWLGAEHPVYQAFGHVLPVTRPAYAYYVRVPDLPAFIQHIAPVLERRLAESSLAGHTGELRIGFYGEGLRLELDHGRLVEAKRWVPEDNVGGDAAFPDLTFLQVLFGYRSMEELDRAFADCWVTMDETRALLDTLFPKQPSHVWAEV